MYISVCLSVGQKIGFETTTCNHQTSASANLLQYMLLLLGIAATYSVTGKEDDGHNIKQAVNCMGPELLLNNAPLPPASNFMHF